MRLARITVRAGALTYRPSLVWHVLTALLAGGTVAVAVLSVVSDTLDGHVSSSAPLILLLALPAAFALATVLDFLFVRALQAWRTPPPE